MLGNCLGSCYIMALRNRLDRNVTPQRTPGLYSAAEVLMSARTEAARTSNSGGGSVGTPHLPRPLHRHSSVRPAISNEKWVNMYEMMYG